MYDAEVVYLAFSRVFVYSASMCSCLGEEPDPIVLVYPMFDFRKDGEQ